MRVLFVALGIYSRIGGIERFNQRVVRCLAELSPCPVESCRIVVLWDAPRHLPDRFPALAFTPGSSSKLQTLAAFARHVTGDRPDLIVYGHILVAPLAAIARTLSPHSRNLLMVHGIEVWNDPSYRRTPFWEPPLVRRCVDRIISVSRFTQQRMQRAFGLDDSRFALLPNAVDVEVHEGGAQPPLKAPGRPPRLLTVTRLDFYDRPKGCGQVIRALPGILAHLPDLHYYLVGDGPLKGELQRLADALGVSKHVHFLGYLDDTELAEAYRLSDVFAMPSRQEGFGIVFLEAWKHGLPVIAGNRDAGTEVVTHGLNGLTVNPDSLAEITEAVVRLCREPETRLQMGRKGFETVLAHYTHDRFLQKFAGILKESGS